MKKAEWIKLQTKEFLEEWEMNKERFRNVDSESEKLIMQFANLELDISHRDHWILDDGNIIAASLLERHVWNIENPGENLIQEDTIYNCIVSTTFIGMRTTLFETGILNCPLLVPDDYNWWGNTGSLEDAKLMHKEAVQWMEDHKHLILLK